MTATRQISADVRNYPQRKFPQICGIIRIGNASVQVCACHRYSQPHLASDMPFQTAISDRNGVTDPFTILLHRWTGSFPFYLAIE
jgi:hypothetical protein